MEGVVAVSVDVLTSSLHSWQIISTTVLGGRYGTVVTSASPSSDPPSFNEDFRQLKVRAVSGSPGGVEDSVYHSGLCFNNGVESCGAG